jgi:hypothetical protein
MAPSTAREIRASCVFLDQGGCRLLLLSIFVFTFFPFQLDSPLVVSQIGFGSVHAVFCDLLLHILHPSSRRHFSQSPRSALTNASDVNWETQQVCCHKGKFFACCSCSRIVRFQQKCSEQECPHMWRPPLHCHQKCSQKCLHRRHVEHKNGATITLRDKSMG